jgi:hypothetical protein
MRTVQLVAAVAALCAPSFAANANAPGGLGLGQQFPRACASGYHADAGGNCQPNVAQVNRYCPPGTVYHPWWDGGWYCEAPPPQAY